jgi:hypothetical protein
MSKTQEMIPPLSDDQIQALAVQMSLEVADTETLISDILPVLKRKLQIFIHESKAADNSEKSILTLLRKELTPVLSNYGLQHLADNKSVLQFIIKDLSEEFAERRAKRLADRFFSNGDQQMAEQLAYHLGVPSAHGGHFTAQVMPKLKKYTKSMYRKRYGNGDSRDASREFDQFILDNIFIDEFENHIYIRSCTDPQNRAILRPEAKTVALKMIAAWRAEVLKEIKSGG